MVIQLVTVTIKPEQRERWVAAIQQNAAQTRTENGCELYRVAEDLERPNTFVIVERWSSLEAQYAHFRRPEFSEMLSGLGEILAAPPEVSINEIASTETLDEALAAAGATARGP